MSDENLQPRQKALYQALEIVAEAFGDFDQSSGANGAHYMAADDNPFVEEGLMCANCVFYEGGQRCEIVQGQIDPLALCKLWIIDENLLSVNKGSSHTPPEGVRAEARRALKWIDEGHAGDGFTAVGRKRAADLARGAAIGLDTIRRMRSFLARHEVDKKGQGWSPDQDGYPSPGRVAWAAWGGDAAKSWVASIVDDMEKAAAQSFGSRSQAGRYAAQIRWGRAAAGGGDGPVPPAVAANAIAQDQPATIRREDIPATMTLLSEAPAEANLYNLKIVGGPDLTQGRNPADLVPRDQLPQAPSARKAEFVTEMRDRGLNVTEDVVDPSTLTPMQNHLSAAKVGQMMGRMDAGTAKFDDKKDRIIVSRDGYIMDGHHRYAAAALRTASGKPTKLTVYKVDANRDDLVGIMKAWNQAAGIRSLGAGQSNPNSAFKSAEKAVFYREVDKVIAEKDATHG